MFWKHEAQLSGETEHIPLLLPAFCQVLSDLECLLLQIQLEMLYLWYVSGGHMILDCEQTVLHMPLFVPWVDWDSLVIPFQIILGLVSWEDVAACSCIDFTVCLVYFGVFRLCYPGRSDVPIVFVFHVVEFGGSLEAFHRCSCLVICVIKWSCVLTLGRVLRLFFLSMCLISVLSLSMLCLHMCVRCPILWHV